MAPTWAGPGLFPLDLTPFFDFRSYSLDLSPAIEQPKSCGFLYLCKIVFRHCETAFSVVEETDENLRVDMTLLGAGVSMTVFALLGGQPLLIVGTTAPVTLFEKVLYMFSVSTSPLLLLFHFRHCAT